MGIGAEEKKVTSDLLNISRLCGEWFLPLKTVQWPANIRQVYDMKITVQKSCRTLAGCEENYSHIRKLTSDLPVSGRLSNWPTTCVMLAGLIQKKNEICETRKLTSDLPDISRLRGKPVTHPKIDQWPANIRQVEQLTNNLCYVSRFHPQEKVWINLLDGGRFLDTFSTCSYMAGCLEWLAAVTTGAELSSGVIKLTASLKKKTK